MSGPNMNFLHLFHKQVEFGNIVGYDDIKDLVRCALDSNENYNLLLCGPPASAKTLFLLGILECRRGVYFDGSNTTNRILDVLQRQRPKVTCIDELEKMPRNFQNQLLNFLESGRIKVDQQRRSYDLGELKPDYADSWNSKGNTLTWLDKYNEAIKCYDKAIELKPDYADAWYEKGKALHNLTKYNEAIKCYDKAIELKPDYANAWNSKSITLQALGNSGEAKEAFDRAKELGYI
jgi:tetratricopeptide (TPR) repeat protein